MMIVDMEKIAPIIFRFNYSSRPTPIPLPPLHSLPSSSSVCLSTQVTSHLPIRVAAKHRSADV